MIELVVAFLILALVAGILGFSGIQLISIDIARTLFVIFLFLFAISLIWRLVSGRKPPL
jgi:uncharacterized membrane protein YtjA (UPF0391 family)